MEPRRILENIAFISMGLCILILAGLSIFQYQQIRKLSQNASPDMITGDNPTAEVIPSRSKTAHQNPAKGKTLAGIKNESATDEINDLEFQLKAVEEELDITHEQLFDEISRQEELREKEKQQDEDWKQNSMRIEAKLMRIEDDYADLFEDMDLSLEELEEFKKLLVDRSIALSDQDREEIFQAVSENEKRELQQETYDIVEWFDTKTRDFLEDEDFKKYHEYAERLTEREIITAFNESLDSPGDNLSDAQAKQLIDAMYKERNDAFSIFSDEPYSYKI